jgi:WD40 repeat protein
MAFAVPSPTGSEVKLWDLIDDRQRVLVKGQEPIALEGLLAFSPDGRAIGVAAESGILRILDVATGTERYRAEGVHLDKSMETPLALTPTGLVAFGRRRSQEPKEEQTTVRLRNLRTGEERVVLEGERVLCLSFSPDGQLLAVGRGSKGTKRSEVAILDTLTGRERFVLGDVPGLVEGITFSRDGGKLAVVWIGVGNGGRLSGGGLRVWDLSGERPFATLREDSRVTTSVSFSRDGQTLVSGGMDGAVRIWDTGTGVERAVLKGSPGVVVSATFSRDSKNLVAVILGPKIDTGSVKVWDVGVPRVRE